MDPKSLPPAAAAPSPNTYRPPDAATVAGVAPANPAPHATTDAREPQLRKNAGRGRFLHTLAQQVGKVPAKINHQFQKHKPILDLHARSLVCDRQQLAKHPLLGIPMAHIEILERYAAQDNNDCVIGIRPVGPMARSLIEAGYPAKPLEVKAKSSDIGPVWGFIPVDPMYSKSRRAILQERKAAADGGGPQPSQGQPTRSEQKAAAQIRACTEPNPSFPAQPPVACKVALRISSARFAELEQAGMFVSKKLDDDEFLLTTKMDRVRLQFRARKDGDQYRIFDSDYHPIEVLAPTPREGSDPLEAIKPFVPDYDLLAVGVNLAKFGAEDNCSVSRAEGGDPHLGIISERLRQIVGELGRPQYFGREVVRHGEDVQNPGSDPGSNYPALFILPKPMRGMKRYRNVRLETANLVPSMDAHRVVQQICHDNNYNLPAHETWTRLTHVRSASFDSAKGKLESRKQSMIQKARVAQVLHSVEFDDDNGGPSTFPLAGRRSLEALSRSSDSSQHSPSRPSSREGPLMFLDSLGSRSRRSSRDVPRIFVESLEACAEEQRHAKDSGSSPPRAAPAGAGKAADRDDPLDGAGLLMPGDPDYLTDIPEERSGAETSSVSSRGSKDK